MKARVYLRNMNSRTWAGWLLVVTAFAVLPAVAISQTNTGTDEKKNTPPKASETVTVYGWRNGNSAPLELSTDTVTDPASVSVITQEDLNMTVTSTPGDLLRGTTGVQVSDFGQPGEAQGITMRGWSNGYDSGFISFTLDGFQRNQPSNVSVNGYMDINPLIPETVDRITVIRGPSDVRYGGDFAQAGSVVVSSRDYIPTGVSITGGSFGNARTLAVYGFNHGTTNYYTAVDLARQDGYRDNSEIRTVKSFSKYSTDIGGGHLALGLETYTTSFHLPGYIDEGYIKDGTISARSAASYSDHGRVGAYALTGNYSKGSDAAGFDATVYLSNNALGRYTTTTPYPQFYRSDHRWVSGGTVNPHWHFRILKKVDTLVQAGASIGNNSASINEFPSADGKTDYVINADNSFDYHQSKFNQLNSAYYGAIAIKPFTWMKLTGGLRYDHFYYDVADRTFDTTTSAFVVNPLTAGTGRFDPKVGVAVQVRPTITIFGNFGESPYSPSAWTDLPSNPKLSASHLRNEEVGVSYDSVDGKYHLQAVGYKTLNLNEIGEVGYQVVNLGSSHRSGYDLEGAVGLFRSGTSTGKLIANYSRVSATLSGGGFVPYVSNWLATYGFQLDHKGRGGNFSWNFDDNFMGPQKLDSAAEFVSKTYNRISTKLAYTPRPGSKFSFWAGGMFYPGDRYSEFAFDLSGRVYTNPEPTAQAKFGLTITLPGHQNSATQ